MKETHHQPEGARNDITSHDEPTVYETPAPIGPPVTFNEAASHSPYELLRELEEHHLSVDLDDQRRSEPQYHLAELALSSAVVWW